MNTSELYLEFYAETHEISHTWGQRLTLECLVMQSFFYYFKATFSNVSLDPSVLDFRERVTDLVFITFI